MVSGPISWTHPRGTNPQPQRPTREHVHVGAGDERYVDEQDVQLFQLHKRSRISLTKLPRSIRCHGGIRGSDHQRDVIVRSYIWSELAVYRNTIGKLMQASRV